MLPPLSINAVETEEFHRPSIEPEFPDPSVDRTTDQVFTAFDPRDLANFSKWHSPRSEPLPLAARPHLNHVQPLDGSIGGDRSISRKIAESLPLAFVPAPGTFLPQPAKPQKRRVDRKIRLIRRSGLFGADTKGAKISRAATLEDLREAYKLVHRVYLGTGYISKEDAAIRFRLFETSNYTATFVAKKDGRVVGVLSIVHDSPAFGLPSDEVFSDELRALRASKVKLVEVTNQAVDEEFRCTAVPTELMRCALAHSIEMGVDIGIAAVSPSHHCFYELLGFEKIGGERSYSGKLHDPVVPVQIDLNAHRRPPQQMDEVERFMHSFLTAENPYFLYVESWENAARAYFGEPHILRGLLQECSEEQLRALHKHWDALSQRIAGPAFVTRLDSPTPDLRDLCTPQPDRLFIPTPTAESERLREIDQAVACGRCAIELGLPDADVKHWKEQDGEGAVCIGDQSERVLRPKPSIRRMSFRRTRRLRDLLSVFWRHAAWQTPREAT